MLKTDIEEILNTSMPCYEVVDMPTSLLTNICSDKEAEAITAERNLFGVGREIIESKIDGKIPGKLSGLFSNLSIVSDYFDAYKHFDFNDLSKYKSLFLELDAPFNNTAEKTSEMLVKHRLDFFEQCVIYVINHFYSTQMHEYLKKKMNSIYYSRPYNADLRGYLVSVLDYYKQVMNNLDNIVMADASPDIDAYLDKINARKTALLIGKKYMEAASLALAKGNYPLAQKYLFYIASFVNNKKNDVGLKVLGIDYTFLANWYKSVIKQYNFNTDCIMDGHLLLGNIQGKNERIIDTIISMQSIKSNEEFVRQGYSTASPATHTGVPREPLSEEDEAKIKLEVDKRRLFYLERNPIAQIVNSGDFRKYIAFLYENGLIVADRLEGIESLSALKSDAIYLFDAINFEDKITKGKSQLIGEVPRLYHSGAWQKRANNYIMQETSEELHEEAQKLVRKKNV